LFPVAAPADQSFPDLPKLALSVMQPWPWLIVHGFKDIENRDWSTRYRGPVALHAGKKQDQWAINDLKHGYHPVTYQPFDLRSLLPTPFDCGGIVGVVDIVDCVDRSDSEWFVGRYGFVLRNARPVDFIPVKGALNFFDWRKNLMAVEDAD